MICAVSNRANDKILLARSPRHPEGVMTTLAGFVEAGELSVGHKVNHPPKGTRPTVHALPLDLDEDEHVELHPYLPVVHATLPPAGSGTPWKRTAVLVASRALCDEELWLDYKLCGEAHVLPDWYTPCKPANPEPTNRAMGPDESGDIIIDA